MSARSFASVALAAAATASIAGCLGDPQDSSPFSAHGPYDPNIPEEWAASVTNPYFPLTPGTSFEFRADTDDGAERTVVEVLSDTKVIQGVTATVVRDRVFVDGELLEDTFDWYAQDSDGNVWYLGEDTKEYLEDGTVSTAGSWEWGVDDALPGVIMWAHPEDHLRETYRQEFFAGEAEDLAKVVSTGVTVRVPYGTLHGCIETLDWSALEPSHKEHKFYAPGIGVVLEVPKDADERSELIDVTP